MNKLAASIVSACFRSILLVLLVLGTHITRADYASTLDALTGTVPADNWQLNVSSVTGTTPNLGSKGGTATFNSGNTAVSGPQPDLYTGFPAGNNAVAVGSTAGGLSCGTGAAIPGTGNFSVVAWIKTTASGASRDYEIVSQRDSSGSGYNGTIRIYMDSVGRIHFWVYESGFQWTSGSDGSSISTPLSYNDGKWHQIVCVRSGATGSIYLDGASVASNTGTAAKNLAALGVYIGYNQRDNWGFFNGSIAQTAIYSSALTAGNVTSLYTAAGYTPPLSVVKAATGTDLTAGASWTGGSAPTTSISGTWTGSSLGAGLTVGSDVSWAAISVASAASDIAITGAGTLTLGAAGIDMSASSVNLSIANSTALGASQSWVVNTGKSLSDSGVISGSSYSLDKSGAGTLTLSGNSTYSGGTTLNAGQLNINNGGSSSANSAIGTGTLTLAGGTIDNTSAGDVTLSPTIAQSWNGDFTYAGSVHNLNLGTGTVTLGASRQVTVTANTLTLGGSISGTGLNLTKAGAGTLALAGGATLATLQPDVGTLAISAGDINVATQIGNSDWGTARTSTVNQTDGTVTLASNAKYYGSRSGNQAITYNLSGGTFDASIGRFNIAWDGGSNNPTFTVSGGLLKVYGLDGASSIGGAASAGTLALTGGQITIGANGIGNANYNASNYANALNFGGGTIAASTGFSGGALQAITLTGTGGNTTFDTTGGNISLAGVLNGAGGLNKAGSGTLTLSNTNTYAGTTTLNAGSLTLSGSGTLGGSGSALTVTGGTLDLGALSRTNGAVLISGAGTIQNGTLTGSSYSATLTSGTATVSAVLAGSSVDLTMNGAGGTLTLNNANTYSGNTSINAGTLALGASGALNAASNVSIAAGGTFDVSAFTTYTLGASASLSASGNATAATLKGDTEVNLGSRPIALTWSGASSGTDSAHPALTVSQGTLALSNNTFTVVVPGSALDVGVYTLVSAPSITGSVNFAPSFTGGNGLVVGDVGIVSISGNNVILTVSMPSATLVASGSPISSLSTSYGTPSSEKSFTVAGTTLTAGVTVTPPAGYEVSTTSGSGYTGSGTAITFGSAPTVATTTVYVRLAANAPVSGTYDSQSLVLSSPQAVDIYVATASSGNSVAAKALTLDSATAQDKAYDGTTAGTVTGAFQTAQAFGSGTSSDGIPYTGDILTASAPGTFASSEIGTGISVTADTFTLGGSSAGNYTLTQPTGLSLSASIISTATWSNLAGGSWPTVGNWLNGVGNGADITADFSTLTLAANPTVTLDGARTIGNLTFGDVGNTHAWTVNTGSGGPLTLATSSGSSVITVSNQSTTIAAVLAGTNGLIKTGAGRLTLSVANSYTGATTISQGTIIDSSSNALGTAATVVINDANTAANDTSLLLGSLTLSKAVTVANQGSGTTTLGANGSVANPEFSGAITLAKDVILNGGTNTDRLTFTGGISGTGNVTIASTGRVMFLNAANTFNGNLTINDGSILQLHWGDPSSISYIPDASILTVNGTLKFAKKNSSETIGGLSGNGTLQGHEGVTNSATGLVINATGDNTFSGVLSDGGATGSKLSLTKSGAGSQTLSGTNSYSGTTTINGGTLSLGSAGSIANSSSISVASGAVLDALTSGLALDNGKTLRGSGSVIGNVACGTTGVTVLAPGNGTDGSLTITGNLTLAGAADINIGLLASYSAAAALAVTGDLDATTAGTGNVVINLPTTSVDAGIYHLVSHTNTLADLDSFTLGTVPLLSSRQTGELVNNEGFIDYVVSGINPVWTGALGSQWSSATLADPKNWIAGVNTTDYQAGDAALFNDSATGFTVDLAEDVSPAAVEFANSAQNYTLQSSGGFGIIDAAILVKSGSGELTINNANTFVGGTTLAAGTITLGTATALGFGSVALNGGTLAMNGQTIDNAVILGGGGITGIGTIAGNVTGPALNYSNLGGTLTLTGSNSYGATTINAGTLQVGNGSTSGSLGTGSVTNQASLVVKRSDALSIGLISGSGTLAVDGGGTLTLNGANTYTGTTTINGSTLVLAMAETWSTSHVGSLVTINSGGTLRLDSYFGTGFAYGFPTSGTAADIMINAGGTFDKNGKATYIRSLTMSGNAAVVGSGANAGDNLQLCANLTATSTAAGAPSISGMNLVAGTYTDAGNTRTVDVTHGVGSTSTDDLTIGVIGQASPGTAANLIKTGAGTLKLTGANTYAGTTTVSQGTLSGAASLVGPLDVQAGATLAPGSGIGTFGAGTTTLAGSYVCEVEANTSDVLAVTGALDLTGATLALSGTPAVASYTIATYTGALTGTFTASPALPTGYSLDYATVGQIKLVMLAGFSSWIEGFTFADGADKTAKGDPDGDGVSNLMEYALAGRNPTVSDGATGVFDGGLLSFTKRDAAAADASISYAIQESDDLGVTDAWTEVGGYAANDATTISFTLPTGKVTTFARLVVTQVP